MISLFQQNENVCVLNCVLIRITSYNQPTNQPSVHLPTYLPTYLPNSENQKSYWEADGRSASQETPHLLWNPKEHYCVHKSLLLNPI